MRRLEEVREFNKLMAKKKHFRRREKLKQRLQSGSGPPLVKEQQWLQPSGVDRRRRLETQRGATTEGPCTPL